MINDTDISEEKEWLHEEHAKIVVANLQKKRINAQYVSRREEAVAAVLGMIPPGATVARGDSLTLEQAGITSALSKSNQNKFIDPFETKPDGSFIETREQRLRMKEAFSADIFLTGTNAVTLDGKLVNTDGEGNRVAAMVFGPEKVIVVAGINKIVKNVDEALERIREVAAPINAKRHYLKHHIQDFGDLPCVRTGSCIDCNHDRRICWYTVIIEGASIREKGRINVVLVGEELGI